MDLKLKGKSVLVTGSSRGIGKAIAETLCAEGCRVAINGRDQKNLTLAASEMPNTISIVGDVTDPQQAQAVVSEAIRQMGNLDILVCNVGGGRSVPPGRETPEEWERVFALNLWSTTNTVQAARDALVSSKGTVVCISSICGLEVIAGAPITYSAAKAALHAYVRGIARPLGAQGVRINAVAPGNILFDESVWAKKLAEDRKAVESMLEKEVSLSTLGTPDQVANLVAYLASPQSGFATGGVWTLDGGQVRS